MAGSPRYLRDQIQRDLSRKMVFVAGPRQVGKTTLARTLPGAGRGYVNADGIRAAPAPALLSTLV